MTFDEWFHKEYEPADLQINQCAERNEVLHIPATVYLEDLKKAYEAGQKDKVVEHFEAYGQCRDSRRIASLEAENERLTVSYETLKLHDEEEIGMLKSKNAELKKQNKILSKALNLYINWADECGIAWDNFPDMTEKWYKIVEEKGLGWIAGLTFMVMEEAKEQLASEVEK